MSHYDLGQGLKQERLTEYLTSNGKNYRYEALMKSIALQGRSNYCNVSILKYVKIAKSETI